jgi:cadmium resistance protein CadD (predicted permease)
MEKLIVILGAMALIVLAALLFAFPVKWLWNWLMPDLFGLVKITVWQALGLNLLSGFLLKTHTTTK